MTDRQQPGLATIFVFFLGLMALAFIGVGVNTFYPSPEDNSIGRSQEISREIDALNRQAAPGQFSEEQRAEFDRLARERDELSKRQTAAMKNWARVTGIVVVLFATLMLVISLLLSERIRLIANGLLLGGLFSMMYGVGWVLSSGNSPARFGVIVFALVVALALGYHKFVRGRRPGAESRGGSVDAGVSASGPGDGVFADLAARVDALEARAAAAAAALRGEDGERKA